MKFPCEEIVSKIIPSVRAEIAIRLYQNHNLKQIEISKILGITQGAVSHYLTEFRGKDREALTTNTKIDEELNEITNQLINGVFDKKNVCEICQKIQALTPSNP